MDENILWIWLKILAGFSAAVSALAVFLMKYLFNRHNTLFTDVGQIKKDHSEFQLKVSEEYAKKTDLNSARDELNDSVKRIHQRIDNLPKDIVTLIRKEP